MSTLWEVADRCGSCGNAGWTLERTICSRRYGRCRHCGLARLIDRLAEDQLPLIYGNYYRPAATAAAALDEQLRNPTFAFRRSRLEAALGERRRSIWEVGCGDGNFLVALRDAGWAVQGSEYITTAEAVAQRHQLDVRAVDVVHDTPAAITPVVAAYHVLEHIYEPVPWLQSLARMLEPDGLLHLQVPNYEALGRTLGGEAWSSWRLPEHVYFYTRRTLADLLATAGFRAASVTTWDPWHGPGGMTTTLSNMVRMRATGESPWTADVERGWPAGGFVPSAAPRPSRLKAVGRGALTRAARGISRVASFAGRGEVIDVIAVRASG